MSILIKPDNLSSSVPNNCLIKKITQLNTLIITLEILAGITGIILIILGCFFNPIPFLVSGLLVLVLSSVLLFLIRKQNLSITKLLTPDATTPCEKNLISTSTQTTLTKDHRIKPRQIASSPSELPATSKPPKKTKKKTLPSESLLPRDSNTPLNQEIQARWRALATPEGETRYLCISPAGLFLRLKPGSLIQASSNLSGNVVLVNDTSAPLPTQEALTLLKSKAQELRQPKKFFHQGETMVVPCSHPSVTKVTHVINIHGFNAFLNEHSGSLDNLDNTQVTTPLSTCLFSLLQKAYVSLLRHSIELHANVIALPLLQAPFPNLTLKECNNLSKQALLQAIVEISETRTLNNLQEIIVTSNKTSTLFSD